MDLNDQINEAYKYAYESRKMTAHEKMVMMSNLNINKEESKIIPPSIIPNRRVAKITADKYLKLLANNVSYREVLLQFGINPCREYVLDISKDNKIIIIFQDNYDYDSNSGNNIPLFTPTSINKIISILKAEKNKRKDYSDWNLNPDYVTNPEYYNLSYEEWCKDPDNLIPKPWPKNMGSVTRTVNPDYSEPINKDILKNSASNSELEPIPNQLEFFKDIILS